MQRSLVLALVLVLAALLGAVFFFSRGDVVAPPPAVGTLAETHAPVAEANAKVDRGAPVTGSASEREVVASRPAEAIDDPEIRAALCGFKGRVVDHSKVAVAETGVRIYRGAQDSVLVEGLDVFADESTFVPQYIAGETKTDAEGRFLVTGVWPRAFYLLYAGIGTDAPTYQIVTRTPSPGEIVDLGDVVLADAGVIVGTVVDENGDALPGALVRAADLPGTLAAFFPVERFDPDGAVLIRERQSPVRVLEMPKWVKGAFDNLPIPSTHTDADGHFRLVGVAPGSNLLATTLRGFLSDMKPSIQVRGGQEKDVGRIRLKRGEELVGKVVDTAGKPVADAEVLAGSTISVVPFDLAQKLAKTDAEGRFQGQGFAAGKVTVAARRGHGHPWVLAEPQPILGDVLVTLPASFAVAVSVTQADGSPAKSPRFQLLQGKAGNGAAEMHLLGFVPPIDLADRQKPVADGQWRIENLNAGTYTLVADAPGCATAFATFDITLADASVALQLTTPRTFMVRVLDQEERPIRNVAIYAEGSGARLVEMPVRCGRTDHEGRLVIDKFESEKLRVSAEHPRWGVVHGEATLQQELVLHMQPPGSLHGLLSENGRPPELGKFTVAVVRQRGGMVRGPLESVPNLVSPGLDGTFQVAALQPGKYELAPVKALDSLRSPGGVFGMMQDAFMMRDLSSTEVEVVAGQTSEVRLEAGEKPIEGPTAQLQGSVTIDGKRGVGSLVMAYGNERRFTAKVDERGRFDLGTVPAGDLNVSVMGGTEAGFLMGPSNNLWSQTCKLTQAEVRELAIEISTSSIEGVCYRIDGTPATGVFVQAQGVLKNGGEEGHVWQGGRTDAQGAFKFAPVAEGTWSLQVRGGEAGRGKIDGLTVTAGVPAVGVRIDLQKTLTVKGSVNLSALGAVKPRWIWIGFYRPPGNGDANGLGEYVDSDGVNVKDGTFATSDLTPGTYRLRVHCQNEDGKDSVEYECDDLVVPASGLEGIVLLPRRRTG